jgi:DNA-binding GntR family transcriptional regulator
MSVNNIAYDFDDKESVMLKTGNQMLFIEEFPYINIKMDDAKSLRMNLVKGLTDAIYSGYLPPGFRIIESELASKLQISRTPVREALLQLESEGFIKIVPNKGAIVTVYSPDEIEEIYLVFGSLAGTAASLSVELISNDGLKQMEVCLSKMDACRDRKEWFALNNEFHRNFLKPCGRKLLLEIIKNYGNKVGRYWYLVIADSDGIELLSQEHKHIFEAFEARDSKMAKEMVEKHIRSVGDIITKNLKIYSVGILR